MLRYVVTQRQNYFKKTTSALKNYDNDLLDVYEDELKFKSVLQRMELKDRDDPDTLIDLFCYACDCFIVSCLVAGVTLKEQCNEYHSVIMHYLSKKKFKYYLAGMYCWQLSRTHNILPLLYAIQCFVNPSFIGYNHMCWECVSFQSDCNHKCCHAWLISRANSLGFSIKKKETLHTKNGTELSHSQSSQFDLFDVSNDLNLLPTPKRSFKCSTIVTETLSPFHASHDIKKPKPITRMHASMPSCQMYLKSRKLSALKTKLTKLKCASIHISNKTSSFQV